jgi:hypothetical protein
MLRDGMKDFLGPIVSQVYYTTLWGCCKHFNSAFLIKNRKIPPDGRNFSLMTKYQYYQSNSKTHKKQKAMLAHSISAFPGGGRCRKTVDEAPFKI